MMCTHQNSAGDARDYVDEIVRQIARDDHAAGSREVFCGHAASEEALEAEIWSFLDGDLDPEAEEAVEARVESCAWCARCYREALVARDAVAATPARPLSAVAAELDLPIGRPTAARSLAGFVLRIVANGIEALRFPGQLVPVPVGSRGPESGAWRGSLQVEYELAGRRLTLVASPLEDGACRVQLIGRRGAGDCSGLVAELHSAGRRICFQPFRESPAGFIWESDRIRPGVYRLVLKKAGESLGDVDVTVLGGDDDAGRAQEGGAS